LRLLHWPVLTLYLVTAASLTCVDTIFGDCCTDHSVNTIHILGLLHWPQCRHYFETAARITV
jgi:hypothetical protein